MKDFKQAPGSVPGRCLEAAGDLSSGFFCFLLFLSFFAAGGLPAKAQTFNVLYAFQGKGDGRNPQVGIFRGAVYGTTLLGGDTPCACGTVFKLSSAGEWILLHVFHGYDGANPAAGLIMDELGNLYGTTSQGGAGSSSYGTIFKMTPPSSPTGHWTESVLYSFSGGTDGAHPYAGLFRDSIGNMYGTTNGGGKYGLGTVFKLGIGGDLTVLYSFAGAPDGQHPYGGVVQGSNGNLYGTTNEGGAFNFGVVFEVDKGGRETVLRSFNGKTDGAYPSDGVVMDKGGNLYGTTNEGGSSDNEGTIFKIDNGGSFSVLHAFTGRVGGANPSAGMVMAPSGMLYGTTTQGGDSDFDGTVFALEPTTNAFLVLHVMAGGNGGSFPCTGVALDPEGNLYGSTANGGPFERGLVFQIIPQ